MNRRSFMALLGLAPLAPIAAKALPTVVGPVGITKTLDCEWAEEGFSEGFSGSYGGIDRAPNLYWRTYSGYDDLVTDSNALLASLKKANRVG